MRIQTNYKHKNSSPEILDYDNSVTEKGQYQSLSMLMKRVVVGEALDVVDYTKKNPFDRMDNFDVLDMYLKLEPQEQARIKAETEARKKEAEASYKAKIIAEYEASKKSELDE